MSHACHESRAMTLIAMTLIARACSARACRAWLLALCAALLAPSSLAAEAAEDRAPAGGANDRVAAQPAAPAADGELRVRLDEDVITGSSERPKVLYILPWRSAQGTTGLDAAPDLKASELFESLDPDAHGRQLRYRQRLAGDGPDATR
jgi:hypothetical protein